MTKENTNTEYRFVGMSLRYSVAVLTTSTCFCRQDMCIRPKTLAPCHNGPDLPGFQRTGAAGRSAGPPPVPKLGNEAPEETHSFTCYFPCYPQIQSFPTVNLRLRPAYEA